MVSPGLTVMADLCPVRFYLRKENTRDALGRRAQQRLKRSLMVKLPGRTGQRSGRGGPGVEEDA